MNITTKIIITDTNIITDLSSAKILDKFVKLDNVYISDMIKNDEINSSTGDIKIATKFKTIKASTNQINEIKQIKKDQRSLSEYDIINYILARDNNGILATGDRKLKEFSENNGIEVIRTLKIIELMLEKNIISKEDAINACILLKNNKNTRIPINDINSIIDKFKKDKATC